MRRTSTLLLGCTAAAVFSLSGCNKAETKAFDADTYFADLKTDVFIDKSGTQLDVTALTDALPDTVNITFDGSTFDKKSGATVLNDVRFTLTAHPDTGVLAKSISIWGGNTTGLTSLLSGTSAETDTPVASRIEATDITLFGLDKLFDPLLEASNTMVDGMPQTRFEGYDFSVGKMILTDFTLHPSVLSLIEPSGDMNTEQIEGWHWLQKAADYNARISMGDMAFYDSTFAMTLTEDDRPSVISGKIGYTGAKDIARGDYGFSITRDMSYGMDMAVPASDGNTRSVKMSGNYTRNTMRDIRLAKAMDHISRGVMPDRKDTDFMSLGVWEGESSTVSFNDKVLYSVGSSYFDMSKFHWLIPEIIDVRVEDMAYDITNFMSYIQTEANAALSEDGKDAAEMTAMVELMPKITAVLKAHDFERPSFDFNFKAQTDAKTGAFEGGYMVGIDNFTRYKMSATGTVPDYDALIALLPENIEDMDENMDNEALKTLFAETLELKSYDMVMTDEGGFEKGFSMAREFAKLAPEDNMQAAGIARMEPAQMREMFAGMILIGAGSAGQAFPPAVDYMQSFSNFIREGGEFSVSVKPSTPMDIDAFQALAEDAQSAPDKVVETLGLTVTHTAPE